MALRVALSRLVDAFQFGGHFANALGEELFGGLQYHILVGADIVVVGLHQRVQNILGAFGIDVVN